MTVSIGKNFEEKRLEIITDMCYTFRHDFGLIKEPGDIFQSGLTVVERKALWNTMAQVFDNSIAPYMDFKE